MNEAERLLHVAADKAGVGLGQMDAILMVGGSCEMQPIYQRMEKIGEEYHLNVCRPDAIQGFLPPSRHCDTKILRKAFWFQGQYCWQKEFHTS